MSSTRIVNGVEYVIPPGTEHIWTPPEQVVVTPPRDDVEVANAIHGTRVQGLVRNQNQQKITELSDQLGVVWKDFADKKITKDQLVNQIADFRNHKLTNLDKSDVDDITIQVFESVMIKMLTESNK